MTRKRHRGNALRFIDKTTSGSRWSKALADRRITRFNYFYMVFD